MARPRKPRRVCARWRGGLLKPAGVPLADIDCVRLRLDELEALRLADSAGLSHEESARRMEVSRPTFSRLIERARRRLVTAVLAGHAVELEGAEAVWPGRPAAGARRGRRYCPQCGQSAGRCWRRNHHHPVPDSPQPPGEPGQEHHDE